MVIPVALVALALLSGMVVAYGTHPNWAQYQHGLDIILWSRTLQWPLLALSLILCLVLIALVITGKRRAWWLIGLGPVLALFMHCFDTASRYDMAIVENPPCVAADDAGFLHPEDYVVGVEFGDTAYAYPYSTLYHTPVVIQSDQARRMMLIWSAFANRAMAVTIDRQLKLRDLEIVSSPANALLLYNSRLGQFINGLTLQTIQGLRPIGFHLPLPTSKMRWQEWRALHPSSRVMFPPRSNMPPGPAEPILPYYPMPPMKLDVPARTCIAIIPTTRPVAVSRDGIATAPVNVPQCDLPVLLFRDRITGSLRAFDRRFDDKTLCFSPIRSLRRPNVVMTDQETHTGWNASGVAVDGDNPALKGRKLTRLREVEDDLYWGVMKFWYPALSLVQLPPPSPESTIMDDEGGQPTTRPAPHVRSRPHRILPPRRPRQR